MGTTRSAFTLIETLIVVSVVLTLAALIAAVSSGATQTAKATKCLNNLRQIGLAAQQYAAENSGWLPQSRHDRQGRFWVEALKPYLTSTNVMRSPLDGNKRTRSYAISDYMSGEAGKINVETYNRVSSVPAPAETLFFALANETQLDPEHFHFSESGGPGNAAGFRSEVWVDAVQEKSSNYLFVDGHVAQLDWPSLQREITRPGSRFVNPAGNN